MKKQILFVIILMLGLGALCAYQSNSIGLFTPSSLDNLQGELGLAHNFYGQFNHKPLDTFLGSSMGANVNLSYRQHLVLGTEGKISYTSSNKKYELGGAWRYYKEEAPVKVQLDLTAASFIKEMSTKRTTDFGAMLSVQNKPLMDRLIFTLNAGYNTYYQRLATGIGAQVMLTDDLSILGEYYPLLDDTNSSDNVYSVGDKSAFAFGLAYDLYGHTFAFNLGNDPYHHDTVGHALGTYTKGVLSLGFNIKRRL